MRNISPIPIAMFFSIVLPLCVFEVSAQGFVLWKRGTHAYRVHALGSTGFILRLSGDIVKLRRVALYSSRPGSCLPGCQLGAKPNVVSIRVSAELLASTVSGRSVQVCLRRHSRQSLIASTLSDSNLDPQLQRSRIIHRARLCRLRLLCLVVGL